MIKKTVIISCAGKGTRLGMNLPKCLVEINGSSLIEMQLNMLRNVEDVRIVVGYKKDLVIDKLASLNANVKVYENSNYENTGTAGSFSVAIDKTVNDYVIALDGDLIVNYDDMQDILNSDRELICGEELNTENPVLVTINQDGKVTKFSREVGQYEWAGLAQIRKENILYGTNHIYQLLEPLLPIDFKLIRAKEIDTPSDLETAKIWLEKNIVDSWFKSRFNIDNRYEVSRYSINNRIDYDINLIEKYCSTDSSILDLGCGTGVIEDRLQSKVKKILAVDKYTEFLDKAYQYDNVTYKVMDITKYCDTNIYNLIIMFGVTMYILDEELEKIIYNSRQMMNENSVFIIKNQWSLNQEDLIVSKEYSLKNKNMYYGIYRTLEKMKKLISNYKLSAEIIDIYPSELNLYNDTHEYAIVCKKIKK